MAALPTLYVTRAFEVATKIYTASNASQSHALPIAVTNQTPITYLLRVINFAQLKTSLYPQSMQASHSPHPQHDMF